MKKTSHLLCLAMIVSCFFSVSTAKNKWRTNVYESSISNVTLDLKGATKEEINNSVQKVLKGKEKWCDAFIKQCPGKLNGVFTFKGKKRVVGIGYGVSAAKARKKANKNNLASLEQSKLNKLGAYSTILKVQTKNGYFIYVIMRTAVDTGFRFEDFNNTSDDILKDENDE